MNPQRAHDQSASGRLDFLIGATTVALALVTFFYLIPIAVEIPTYGSQLSPDFFPKVACFFIGLFGFMLMLKNRLWAFQRVKNDGARILVETLIWCGCAVVTVLLLMSVGYVVTAAISCFAGMVLAGQRRYLVRCALGSILLPLALQQIAWHVFYIQLP